MKNKGELTTQQLVGIIILIMSFVIILFFLFRLNLGETTDKEICHNSVALKAQTALGSGPLDCKTSYVCISGGGKCEGFNPSITIDIDLNPRTVESKSKEEIVKEEIMKAIAEEMADCWWMFGEGKVDYVGTEFFGSTQCALCSIISFDEKIKEYEKLSGGISYLSFYDELKKPRTENKQETYLEYMYNVDGIMKFKGSFDSYLEDYLSNNLDLNKQYFILTGRFAEGRFTTDNWFPQFKLFVKNKPIPVTILEKTNENYQDVGCDEFLTKA